MAILTAQQLKERDTPEFPIDIGGGDEVWARMPDLQLMVMQGILPTPLLSAVAKMIGTWAGANVADLTEDAIRSSDKLLAFVDLLACAALLRPRVVLTAAEATDTETLTVADLTVATKKAILLAITDRMAPPAVVAAVQDFPGGGPGEGAGPDVPEVPAAPV